MTIEQIGLHERLNFYERVLHRSSSKDLDVDKLEEWIDIARKNVTRNHCSLAKSWIFFIHIEMEHCFTSS